VFGTSLEPLARHTRSDARFLFKGLSRVCTQMTYDKISSSNSLMSLSRWLQGHNMPAPASEVHWRQSVRRQIKEWFSIGSDRVQPLGVEKPREEIQYQRGISAASMLK
jgi:hypothetical protein